MLKRELTAVSKSLLLAITVVGLSQVAYGQRPVEPRPTSQPAPPQPTNAAGVPVEGWAIVRYSVLEDGTTANVHVIDAVPPSADTAGTVAAVQRWKFTPAMEGGQAIDWHNNESVVAFGAVEPSAEASKAFMDAYNDIAGRIQQYAADLEKAEEARNPFSALTLPSAGEGQAQTAEDPAAAPSEEELEQTLTDIHDANDRLLNRLAIQFEDLGLALAQATVIRMAELDFFGAHRFVTMATDPRVSALGVQNVAEDQLVALQIRLQAETQLGRTRDAIETIERLTSGLGPEDPNPFAQTEADLRNAWQNTEQLYAIGEVTERPWRFDAGRRSFSITDVAGSVSAINAECDRRRVSLPFQPDAEWQLPDSFGDCTLFVSGEPGTTFRFYELLPPE